MRALCKPTKTKSPNRQRVSCSAARLPRAVRICARKTVATERRHIASAFEQISKQTNRSHLAHSESDPLADNRRRRAADDCARSRVRQCPIVRVRAADGALSIRARTCSSDRPRRSARVVRTERRRCRRCRKRGCNLAAGSCFVSAASYASPFFRRSEAFASEPAPRPKQRGPEVHFVSVCKSARPNRQSSRS